MYQKDRNPVGLILRTFATKPELVNERVEQVLAFAHKALATNLIQRVDVLVWNAKDHKDTDCGLTAEALRANLSKGVYISEVKHGDVFCELLNYGIVTQVRHRIDYSIIASSEAMEYFSDINLDIMLQAASKGARAVGLAINELTDSIMSGRLANTFAMWHNLSLMQVGGFDLVAAKRRCNEMNTYMRGWTEKDGGKEVFYPLHGVEEIIPLARMVDTFGPCIAPVRPIEGTRAAYVVPDQEMDPAGYVRHLQKMGTKFERQIALAASIGVDMSHFEGGIMPEYRKK